MDCTLFLRMEIEFAGLIGQSKLSQRIPRFQWGTFSHFASEAIDQDLEHVL